jgi:hypothetical protein
VQEYVHIVNTNSQNKEGDDGDDWQKFVFELKSSVVLIGANYPKQTAKRRAKR